MSFRCCVCSSVIGQGIWILVALNQNLSKSKTKLLNALYTFLLCSCFLTAPRPEFRVTCFSLARLI